MIQQQMWKRLGAVEKASKSAYGRVVTITSRPPETKEELDELIERWKAGEPMERFGGAYDDDIDLIIVRAIRAPRLETSIEPDLSDC